MLNSFTATNDIDANGNPAGGMVAGTGLSISWQNGPLGQGDERQEPNGAFVETVIAATKQRLEFYQRAQQGKFASRENAMAITKLDEALMWLDKRTRERQRLGVEGTHHNRVPLATVLDVDLVGKTVLFANCENLYPGHQLWFHQPGGARRVGGGAITSTAVDVDRKTNTVKFDQIPNDLRRRDTASPTEAEPLGQECRTRPEGGISYKTSHAAAG